MKLSSLFKSSLVGIVGISSPVLALRPVTLVLFDVDGTLVSGTGMAETSAHARAFGHAVGKVFNNENAWEKTCPSPPQIIPQERYHGGTDGIIALNLAYYAFNVSPEVSYPLLPRVFQEMYGFVSRLSDDEVAKGISPLPGVTRTLQQIANNENYKGHLLTGLVTGNVEGIARKKMRACGIVQTGVFSPKAEDQTWQGEDKDAFLGGFGSCFCSGDIHDTSRIWKDRGEQIGIAARRAKSMLRDDQVLVKVCHVGDAPGDVLGAKHCYENKLCGDNVDVSVLAVATGKFSVDVLKALVGPPQPGWSSHVLQDGLNDPKFIELLGIKTSF